MYASYASYENSGLIKLSLLKATFDDIAYAMALERKILMLDVGFGVDKE